MQLNPKELIYIVNSDPQVNYLLERVLTSSGYEVAVTISAAGAAALLSRASPALLLAAHQLGDGSGIGFISQLVDDHPGTPVLLLINQETPELLKSALKAGVAGYLCMPLRTDEVTSAVQSAIKKAARRAEADALETRKFTNRLKLRVDELETLSQLGRTITASLDLDSVLTAVVDAAVGLTGAEEGSLLLLDESTGELYMRAGRNFQEEFVRTFRLPVKDSLAGNVLRTGQPMILDEGTPQKIKTAYLVQSLLYVPLKSHGRVFGVLGVDNRQNRQPFTENHIKAISAMADYAVIAIDNARMFAQISSERQQLETILTKIQDGVIILDDKNNIVLINQAVREAFQITEENLAGRPISQVLDHGDMNDLLNVPEKRLLNRSEITLADNRVLGLQLTPIPGIGLAVTMHDITYLKKLDRIKSEFVSTVSHDLRSPLTSIMGYVDLLDRVGPINPAQRDFIQRVQASVKNITALVDDLLNLGRIEAGFDTRKEIVPLDHIFQYSLDSFKHRILEKDLQLVVAFPEQAPPLFGNPVQLRQMADNLLDNAIKYSRKGGSLQVQVQVQRNQVILQVKDTGLGIPPSDVPHVFDKFFRASNAASDIPGTGLGLSIVKSIVDSHQGRVWVDSTPGEGTTVTVVLPVAEDTPTR